MHCGESQSLGVDQRQRPILRSLAPVLGSDEREHPKVMKPVGSDSRQARKQGLPSIGHSGSRSMHTFSRQYSFDSSVPAPGQTAKAVTC